MIEYILLLIISASVALLITQQLVSRSPDSPGIIISKWRALIDTIGNDWADDTAVPEE